MRFCCFKISLLFLLLLCCFYSHAQRNVSGYVGDELQKPVENVSITVINSRDSIIKGYTLTDDKGHFVIGFQEKLNGKLIISLPGYADYVEDFHLDSLTNLELKSIKLSLREHVLEEVLVQARKAMTQKGDTLEYDASFYKVEPNDKVEDLLAKLPGMTVGRDGKIISQGKLVKKVLVDGELFFGDDPTLVTKNLRANMVDKIQVYDKKSTKEELTGIKDNNKETTVNVKLKENMKHGVFGKSSLAFGTDGFYEGTAMFNKFKGNEKISGYGIISNTGMIGLGYDDNKKFGNNQADKFSSSTGKYIGEGIPKIMNFGLNYINKFNENNQELATSFNVKNFHTKGHINTNTHNNTNNSFYQYESSDEFQNEERAQSIHIDFGNKVNENSKLKFKLNAGLNQLEYAKTGQTDLTSEQMTNRTHLNRTSLENKNSSFYNFYFGWQRKFAKKGRVMMVSLNQDRNQEKSLSDIENIKKEDDKESLQTNIISNQKVVHFNNYGAITFNEPLSRRLNLSLNYTLNNEYSTNEKNTEFNKEIESIASGNYSFNALSNTFGLLFNWQKAKWTIETGTKLLVNHYNIDQKQLNRLTRNEIYANPNLSLNYSFKSGKTLTVNYDRSISIPSILQYQSFYNIEDPLNLYKGNLNLKDQINNDFSLVYHNFRLLKMRVFRATLDYSIIQNPLSYSTSIDASGINTIETINIFDKNAKQLKFYSHYGVEVSKSKDYLMIVLQGRYSDKFLNINEDLNQMQQLEGSVKASLNHPVGKFFGFNTSLGPVYNRLKSSLNPDYNSTATGFDLDGRVTVKLNKGFSMIQAVNYTYMPSSRIFNDKLDRFLWDVSFKKSFFKDQNLNVTLYANDLLNQNVGFKRFNSNLGITENTYTAIGRYFMLSLSWDFNKFNDK